MAIQPEFVAVACPQEHERQMSIADLTLRGYGDQHARLSRGEIAVIEITSDDCPRCRQLTKGPPRSPLPPV